jgi:hypothetical protein
MPQMSGGSNVMNFAWVCRVTSHPEALPFARRRPLPRHVVFDRYLIGRAAGRADFEGYFHKPVAHRSERQFFRPDHFSQTYGAIASGRSLCGQHCAQEQGYGDCGSFHCVLPVRIAPRAWVHANPKSSYRPAPSDWSSPLATYIFDIETTLPTLKIYIYFGRRTGCNEYLSEYFCLR